MKVYHNHTNESLESILKRPSIDFSTLETKVNHILNDIDKRGNEAVRQFTLQFDGVELDAFEVSQEEWDQAEKSIKEELKTALKTAKKNIEVFHKSQIDTPEPIETMPGVKCWRKSVGIEKVGLYVPGGTAPLFSTVLMLGVPAFVAGCEEIIMCTPPDKSGHIHPAMLYAARLAGVSKVYKVGGVQAIGAMAFGTETIPKVYKIFGPGNQYVTMAKQLVNRMGIAIDMPAGPSEVMVCVDQDAPIEFIAADLLSQAEHGVDSQVVMVSYDENQIQATLKAIDRQLEVLPRKEIAKQALENSVAIVVSSSDEMINVINEYAPEHLILSMMNARAIAEKVINAGSIFLGYFTPESAGDYASGTNHTLPTNGFAKAYSGVSLDSFVKKITFQEISKEGLKQIGPTVEIMAESESLMAHKLAVTYRLEKL